MRMHKIAAISFVAFILFLPLSINLFAKNIAFSGEILSISLTVSILCFVLFVFCALGILRRKTVGWILKLYIAVILIPAVSSLLIFEFYNFRTNKKIDREYIAFEFDGIKQIPVTRRVITNSEGWRSIINYVPVELETQLTFFVGDSFVYGAVDQNQLIESILLNEFLEKRNVIYNFGKNGAGLYEYVEVARNYNHLKPDNVILFLYVGNDFAKRVSDTTSTIRQNMRKTIRKLIKRSVFYRRVSRWWNSESNLSRVDPKTISALRRKNIDIDKLGQGYLAAIFPKGGFNINWIKNAADVFKETEGSKKLIKQFIRYFENSNVCIAIIPMPYQVSQRYIDIESQFHLTINRPLGRELQDALVDWGSKNGICTIDLLPTFQQEEDITGKAMFYYLDGHLRPRGNRLVAKKLYELGIFRRRSQSKSYQEKKTNE